MSRYQRRTLFILVAAVAILWGWLIGFVGRGGPAVKPAVDDGSSLTAYPTNIPHAPPAVRAAGGVTGMGAQPRRDESAIVGASLTPLKPTPTATLVPTWTPAPTNTPLPTPSPPAVTAQANSVGRPSTTTAERLLFVDQDSQQMHVFENGVEIRTIPVSTGRPISNAFTPAWQGTVGRDWGAGRFLNTPLYSDYMWFLFPGPEGSILIHSVPYSREGDHKQYDRLEALGIEPTSNGCVRISPEDAAWLKEWNPVDVPIEISRWSKGIGPAEE